jgi:hypothetical protein
MMDSGVRMRKAIRYVLQALMVLTSIGLLSGCSGVENFFQSKPHRKTTVRTPAAGWVWVPEYYVYDGRYRFVRGYYRKVSRKAYRKRSLRGYGSGSEFAGAR